MKLRKDTEDAIIPSEFRCPHGLTDVGSEVAMGELNPLWLSGGARGVQQGCHIIGGLPGRHEPIPQTLWQVFEINGSDSWWWRPKHFDHWPDGHTCIGTAVLENMSTVFGGNQEVQGDDTPSGAPNPEHGQWGQSGGWQHERCGRRAVDLVQVLGE